MRFVFGDRFLFCLFFVMLQDGPHPRFIPTSRKPIPLYHSFLPYSPTVCLQRLAMKFIRCNYEHAVWFRIPHIYYAQISSRVGLPDSYSRILIARAIFATVRQSLLDFVFIYAVIVNVRQSRLGINIETDVHAGSIEGRARAGNMETAPRCRPNGLRFSCGRAAAQPCDYAAPLAARPSAASVC